MQKQKIAGLVLNLLQIGRFRNRMGFAILDLDVTIWNISGIVNKLL